MKGLLRTSYLFERWLPLNCRHTQKSAVRYAGRYRDKNQKERSAVGDDIYRFNQESLEVYGPIRKRLTSAGATSVSSKKRNRKPLIDKDPVENDIKEAERFVGDEPVDFKEDELDEKWTCVSNRAQTNHTTSNSIENYHKSQDISCTETIQGSQNKFSHLLDCILRPSLIPTKHDNDISKSILQLVGDVRTPSVSTVLNETMPEESRKTLENWKKRKIAELGLEGFEVEMDGIRKRGQDLHLCIEKVLNGVPVSELVITSDTEGYWESIQDVMCDVKELSVTEAKVLHPILQYSGRLDCIAMYKDTLCLIDWKTSAKKKWKLEYTYDNPIQLAAYAGAVNAMDSFDYKINHALLVMMYPDGSPAHAHRMTKDILEKYWRVWLQRLRLYWKLKQNL